MKAQPKRWIFPLALFFLTLFGVFVLPFLLPPPYLAGVSAANVAGFNNKVAALAAAALGVVVFLVYCRWPGEALHQRDGAIAKLPSRLVAVTVAVCACVDAALCALMASAHVRFADGAYFIDQISEHVEYGRKLYDQIEFPYGPIIFYGPVVVHALLSPWHVPLAAAYFVTLVAEHVIGLLLVAYVLNSLPIVRKWKIVVFLFCAPLAVPFTYGLNYTFFRALGSVAVLVAAVRLKSVWQIAGCLAVGEVISLGISPEMGFAFGAASVAFAAYKFLADGKVWLAAIVSPVVGAAIFFVAAGPGYLRMLKLFAHGVYNLVVQPLPHILLFLFALVWLVPIALAQSLGEKESNAPLLLALYVFSIALLPVAFGRADPGHILFNGITLYMLSAVAIRSYSSRVQAVWVTCVAAMFLFTAQIDTRPWVGSLRWTLTHGVARIGSDAQAKSLRGLVGYLSPSLANKMTIDRPEDDADALVASLRSIVGNDQVIAPEALDWQEERALKRSGNYAPTFYNFRVAVLDATAETREIQEFNSFAWALIPKNVDLVITETPATTAAYVGFDLHYAERRVPYVVGPRFTRNLEQNWQPHAEVGNYELYRRR